MHNWRFILQFWVILPIFQSKFDLLICFNILINQISKIIAKNERNNFVHGYGLKSVQEITQNYNGFFQNKVEDGHFIISILL